MAQYLEVHITYRDEPLLNKLYIPLFQKAKETQSEQTLEISEHSIKINGEEVIV